MPSPLRGLADAAVTQNSEKPAVHFATLLEEGEASLVARVNLIRSAKQTIDLQTYIFDTDDSARLVLDELLAAAERGVRVRVLIDQLSAITDLETLAALAGVHVNFQLRVYNPTFGKVRLNYFDYAASVLCCFRRFNQRMHNKLLVVDNAIGIVGGRNYQDDYFDWDEEYNFRDRDVILAGPEARAMSTNFEAFWQAKMSVPVERLNDVGRYILRHGLPALPGHVFRKPERVRRVLEQASDPEWIRRRFVDGALQVKYARYVADLPEKHQSPASQKAILDGASLEKLLVETEKEILVQTPYLVISEQAQSVFRRLRERSNPPRVIISTNSLAATDNPVVYAISYKYKRRNLRELGFDVYEYKPFPKDPPVALDKRSGELAFVDVEKPDLLEANTFSNRPSMDGDKTIFNIRGELKRRQPGGSEVDRELLRTEARSAYLRAKAINKPLPVIGDGVRMGLHAKSLVIDRRIGVIGTHNFDPRSENYNTEGVVVIDDDAFAQALASSIERDISPGNSWVVAPREKLPIVGQLNYNMGRALEAMPVLDFWPWRYATVYEFQPSEDCVFPLVRSAPDFRRCYRAIGDFPGVNVGGKWLLVRMLTAFGAGLVPIL